MGLGKCYQKGKKHYQVQLSYHIEGNHITIHSKTYAKSVEIDSADCDFILSDNYFDMEAGTVTVEILEGTPKTLELRSVYNIR